MKRWGSILLTVILAATLTACGGKQGQPAGAKGAATNSAAKSATKSASKSESKSETNSEANSGVNSETKKDAGAAPAAQTTAAEAGSEASPEQSADKAETLDNPNFDEAYELSRRCVPEDTVLIFGRAIKQPEGFGFDYVNPRTHALFDVTLLATGVLKNVDYEDLTLKAEGEAKLTEDEVRKIFAADFPAAEIKSVDLEDEDAGSAYEIEFVRGNYRGSVQYESVGGRILAMEIKNTVDDYAEFYISDWPFGKAEPKAQPVILPEKAKNEALTLLPGGEIRDFELDEEDGRLRYELEISKDNDKLEVLIDAFTGDVLGQDQND